MINWVAVFRRMLQLYNVRTRDELGMALGIPLNFSLEGANADGAVPWPVLELVVSEKRVSWDWLLTGHGARDVSRADSDAAAARRAAESAAQARAAPRFETRELARVLLHPPDAAPYAPPPPDSAADVLPDPRGFAPVPGADGAGSVPAAAVAAVPSEPPRLSSIRSRLEKEITRVESFLENRSH